MRRRAAVALTAALVSVGAAACGGSSPSGRASPTTAGGQPRATTASTAAATPAPPVPTLDHVVVVVLENAGYSSAMANPTIARLARRWAYATNYYGVTHPSLPNYLALDTGSTHGVSSDCTTCYVSGPDLAQQLTRASVPWNAYFESAPSGCYLGPYAGEYAGKHNPFRYVDAVRSSRTLCSHLLPYSDLTTALSAGTLPRFTWVTPNLCNDGHDCGVGKAATWLDGFVRRLTASRSWTPHSALFVTWDEAEGGDSSGVSQGRVVSSGGGGKVLTLVVSPSVRSGTTVATPLNHYSLLKTVEEALGLPLLGQAAAPTTADLGRFWSP